MPNNAKHSFLMHTAWVLEPDTLAIVDDIITARLEGRTRDLVAIEAAHGTALENRANSKPYAVVDGVAVISVNGVMGKRMGMFSEMSGGVSTQRIQMQVEDALTDPAIEAVVLSIDSPGGTVDGTAELGDFLLANRGIKPVHAYADGLMASGGYWLGACCERITAYRTTQVGSVSVVLCHYDRSKQDEKAGVKRTFITSGEYKRMANDAEPLNEKGEAYLQQSVDRYHSMFIEAVAAGRGQSPESIQEKIGDGRVHIADAALEIGMIDAIGSLAETINAARAAAQEDFSMNKAELKEKFPELHAELIAEGQEQARAEIADQVQGQADVAVSAEQDRILGLYGRVHGEAAGEGFGRLVASGLGAEQVDALQACGFSKVPAAGTATGDGDLKGKILDALEGGDQGGNLANGGQDGDAPDFMAAVDAVVKEKGITRIAAMKLVAEKNPELHAAYLTGKKA